MTAAMPIQRQPDGTPKGGQFTTAARPEADVQLDAPLPSEDTTGFTVNEMSARWHELGIDPADAQHWAARGKTPAEALDWESRGFDPTTSGNWERYGFGPFEAAFWQRHMYRPNEARDWLDEDMPLPVDDDEESLPYVRVDPDFPITELREPA